MRATDKVEKLFIRKVWNGDYTPESLLPSERELALDFKVGRPVIREVLQRLERDGWLTIRSGKRAVMNDYWKNGNLMTLNHMLADEENIPKEFTIHLLELRKSLSPTYVKDAVNHKVLTVVALLKESDDVLDEPQAFAEFDWYLQRGLAAASPNPIYLLILNSFEKLYIKMATLYFHDEASRQASRNYYQSLMEAALSKDGEKAEILVKKMMEDSIEIWKKQIQMQLNEEERG